MFKKNQKSISLHYNELADNAPRITAKGKGEIADKILALAEKYQIPVYQDQILADLLDSIDIQQEIPESLYQVIAEIYAFTYQTLSRGESKNHDE